VQYILARDNRQGTGWDLVVVEVETSEAEEAFETA